MEKHQSKILILVALLFAVFATVVVLHTGKKQSPLPSLASAVSEVTPSPSLVTTVESPDAKVTLTMREKKVDGGKEWVFSVNGKEIFTKTLPSGSSFSIPYNTFSPDNKYIFLKETTPEKVSYLVLAANGVPVAKDTQTFEIVALFTEKHPEYKITDVTGWGGSTLVVINTDKAEGGVGPSFWFDVASRSFIQLTNRFN